MELRNAAVVVTGGTGGLGNRICRAFARAGARVAVVYLQRHEEAKQLAGDLLREGAAASLATQADVTEEGPIMRMVEQVLEAWGRLDVLVNNAAFNKSVPFADLDGLSLELWEHILRANMTGPFLCARSVAPIMRNQGCGHIVNVGSIAGFYPGGSSIAYAVSKAGLAHLTRCLAVALAPHVQVNSVAPGLMEGTRMTERLSDEQRARSQAAAILRRPADKDDVADQVLAFVRSTSTTGQNLVIDGGRFFH